MTVNKMRLQTRRKAFRARIETRYIPLFLRLISQGKFLRAFLKFQTPHRNNPKRRPLQNIKLVMNSRLPNSPLILSQLFLILHM